ncbi:FUT7 (predicted) [Pycnogonum litorale]
MILLWGENLKPYEGRKMFTKCPGEPCTTTTNKSYAEKAKAVLFSIPSLGSNPKLPRKYENQTWIYLNLESPQTDIRQRGMKRFASFQNMFDWTMCHMRDSDIVTPYFTIKRIASNDSENLLDFTSSIRSKIKKKTRLVAWFVTNFDVTPSERHDVVKKLISHGIRVDVYGPSGRYKCPRSKGTKCLELLDRKYKFYLSFENSICKDYVTEKFYKILPYDVVPIVFGGGDYRSIVPPSSFVDVTTFDSIKDVAEFIKRLDKDDKLYEKYFEWKRNVAITLESFPETSFCKVCRRLTAAAPSSSDGGGAKTHRNLLRWWTDGTCLSGESRLSRTIINKTFNY